LNRIRDEAGHIAESLGLAEEAKTLDDTIGALLGTRDAEVKSAVGRARKRGRGYDPDRVDLFTHMQDFLSSIAPNPLPSRDLTQSGRANLAFFEAYFSNFIEGTEFGVDEAHDVVFSGVEPQERPEDAHDIRGTFAVVSSESDMRTVPRSPDELIDILLRRHKTIMEARPSAGAGYFKTRRNKAGGTTFVEPDLVKGTLEKGFECWRSLSDPFARAVMAMFVVSEVHPFADGNGRVGRVMMNAELEAASQTPIMIPIVYRNNYLQALKAASRGDSFEALQRTLAFGQRWVHAVFTSDVAHDLNALRAVIEATNAFRDSADADTEGVRLRLPTPDDFDNAVRSIPGPGSTGR
jgi:fido (protein-threonine AMPylation protein)